MLLNVVYIKSCRADRISSVLDHVMLSQSYYRSSLFIPIPLEYTLIHLDLSSILTRNINNIVKGVKYIVKVTNVNPRVLCVQDTAECLQPLTFNLLHVILID